MPALPWQVLRLAAPARYGVAAGAVVVATLLRLALEPVWGLRLPFTLFYPAIMLGAWAGGLGPGFAATLLSAAAASYFWVPPAHSWRIEDGTELLGVLLAIAGHTVRLAADGPSALAEAAEFEPEVALLDIGLPGMDGYELARRLKKQGAPGGMVLVALSGFGQDEDRRQGQESGFDHYLVKPATPEAILAILGRPPSVSSRPRPAPDGS